MPAHLEPTLERPTWSTIPRGKSAAEVPAADRHPTLVQDEVAKHFDMYGRVPDVTLVLMPEGILSELRNAFRRDRAPSVPQMLTVYGLVNSALDSILTGNGTRNPYSRGVFLDLCSLSRSLGNFYPPAKPTI